jgi:hypothetical protein
MNAKKILAVALAAGALVAGMGPGARAEMKQRNIARYEMSVPTPVSVNAVRVQAGPRQLDPRYYDVQITIAGEAQPLISVFTGNMVGRPRIDQELIRTAAALADLSVDVHYLYDDAKAVCAASVGATCAANLPFDPTQLGSVTTITTNSKAELLVQAAVGANGTALHSQLVKIPFVGQATAIVPNNSADN